MLRRLFPRPAPAEVKHARVAALDLGAASGWGLSGTEALVREGYRANPVANRCVRLVAESAAATPLTLRVAGAEPPDHPVTRLLARPNPRETGAALLERAYAALLVAGEAHLLRVRAEDEAPPAELHLLRPGSLTPMPGPDGAPEAWAYRGRVRDASFPAPDVLHLTVLDPLGEAGSCAPLRAAARAIEAHNAASIWNKALLDNAARPSGALVYAPGTGAGLTDRQFERLKEELEAGFQGAANAGRPLLLEGGLDWRPLSLTPRDMDFLEAKAGAAREIALAFGVPPMLLGLPGDNSYANHAEASRALWRTTVLPLVARTAAALAAWLEPAFGEEPLELEPDLDRVEALAPERESLWRRVTAAPFLTDDEKREAVGYARLGARD